MSNVTGTQQGWGRPIEEVCTNGQNSMQMPHATGSHGIFLNLDFIIEIMGSHWGFRSSRSMI